MGQNQELGDGQRRSKELLMMWDLEIEGTARWPLTVRRGSWVKVCGMRWVFAVYEGY